MVEWLEWMLAEQENLGSIQVIIKSFFLSLGEGCWKKTENLLILNCSVSVESESERKDKHVGHNIIQVLNSAISDSVPLQ